MESVEAYLAESEVKGSAQDRFALHALRDRVPIWQEGSADVAVKSTR